MPTRNNTKRSDWIWVKLKKSERAAQGKKTVFRFKSRIYQDADIKKRIRRNTTLTQTIIAIRKPMPETPKGWTATTPPATPERTSNFPLHQTPDDNRTARYSSTHSSTIDIDHEYRAESNREQFDRMEDTTTMFQQFDVSDGEESGFPESRRSPQRIFDLNDYYFSRYAPKPGHPYYYNYVILHAARYGDANGIRLAIKCGADPSHSQKYPLFTLDHRDSRRTPLHYVALYGHLEAARVLIDAGARINERCRQGKTPLDMADEPISGLVQSELRQWLLMSETRNLLIENGAKRTWIDTTGQRILDERYNKEGTNRASQRALDEHNNREGATRANQLVFDKWDHRNGTSGDGQHILDEENDKEGKNRAIQCVPDRQGKRETEKISPSPMSWQYTALGAPEVLKESPFKLSRFLGCSARSTAISIDGSSYRPSAPEQASLSLKAILLKNSQGSHKSWATPPMRTPPL